MNEAVAIGGQAAPRESGMLAVVAGHLGAATPNSAPTELHDRLLKLWGNAARQPDGR